MSRINTGRDPYQKGQDKSSAPRKGIRKVSAKKSAYRASSEGKAAMEYMNLVKQLPCCICGAPAPSIAHHVINDRFGTRKASDFDTIPLCQLHHDHGHPDAIHTNKTAWAAKYGPDYSYVETTRKLVAELFD